MELTALEIENARSDAHPRRLSDGDGLALQAQPNGRKLWRRRHCFVGVEKPLSLGAFPAATLAEARARRDAARSLLMASRRR